MMDKESLPHVIWAVQTSKSYLEEAHTSPRYIIDVEYKRAYVEKVNDVF